MDDSNHRRAGKILMTQTAKKSKLFAIINSAAFSVGIGTLGVHLLRQYFF